MQLGVLEYLISVNDKGVNEGINRSESKIKSGAAKAEKTLKDTGSRISAWTIAKGQMIAKYAEQAINTVSNIGKSLLKDAIGSYADREQLEGGVETLFGDAAKKVMDNAERAYKAVGISANQYMETVTSFSASLLQSMGGDALEAANIADMALQDMSDNANKMGSDMEAIQNAYRGFAKQNYTMLDNLKLGYGGTKSEMDRLLKDAEKLTGQKYDIKNLRDVYNAIHAIQGEMGITGTTALEAEKTISGSLNMTKAAWADLLTTIADPNGDVKKAMDNVFSSAKSVLKNLKPVVKRTVTALIDFAKQALPEVWNILKTDVLPFAKGLIKDIIKAIGDALGNGKIFDSLFKKVIPKLVNTIKTKVLPALKKVTDNISSSMKASDNPFIRSIGGIVDGLSLFLDENGNFRLPSLSELWEKLKPALTDLWDGVKGLATSILKLVFGEDENGGIDWPTPEEWGKIVEKKLSDLWEVVRSAAGTILRLVFGEDENGGIDWPTPEEWGATIEKAIDALWETIKGAASSLLVLVFGTDKDGGVKWPEPEEWFNLLKSGLETSWNGVKGLLSGLLKIIFGESPDGGIQFPQPIEMWNKVKQKFIEFWNGFKVFLQKEAIWTIGNIDLSSLADPAAFWDKIKGTFEAHWKQIVPFITSGAAWPIGMLVFGAAESMWKTIKPGFDAFWANLSGLITGAADWLIGKVLTPSANAVIKTITDWWNNEVRPKIKLTIASPVIEGVGDLAKFFGGYDKDSAEANLVDVITNLWRGNAKGNWMVPYDNYPALLHRDEMVLTKSQARKFRDGEFGGNGGISGDMLASAVEAAMSKVYVMLSGEKVGDLTTRRIKRNINASSYSRLRALGG